MILGKCCGVVELRVTQHIGLATSQTIPIATHAQLLPYLLYKEAVQFRATAIHVYLLGSVAHILADGDYLQRCQSRQHRSYVQGITSHGLTLVLHALVARF